jgi:hypothetical protein
MASHINALMMAGVITTSTFLSGVIYYLMTTPKAFNKLKTELRSRFTSVDDITCASTAKCEYLTAVIKEGLRIYPPAGGAHLPRLVPPEGAWISGYWVPGGVSRLHRGQHANCKISNSWTSYRPVFRYTSGRSSTTKSISTGRTTSFLSAGSQVSPLHKWAIGSRGVSLSRMVLEGVWARSECDPRSLRFVDVS